MVPSLGLRITNLRRPQGREWLWRNDQIPVAAPDPDRSYVETAGFGGWANAALAATAPIIGTIQAILRRPEL